MGLMQMGAGIDRALMMLTGAMPECADKLGQARQLIQASFAQYMSQNPGADSSTPATPGNQFTGGGYQTTGSLGQ